VLLEYVALAVFTVFNVHSVLRSTVLFVYRIPFLTEFFVHCVPDYASGNESRVDLPEVKRGFSESWDIFLCYSQTEWVSAEKIAYKANIHIFSLKHRYYLLLCELLFKSNITMLLYISRTVFTLWPTAYGCDNSCNTAHLLVLLLTRSEEDREEKTDAQNQEHQIIHFFISHKMC